MARLSSKSRNALPSSKFGLPKQRKYPLDTRNRDINAKGRATQMEKRGIISPSTKAKIVQRANAALGAGHKSVRNSAKHEMKLKHG